MSASEPTAAPRRSGLRRITAGTLTAGLIVSGLAGLGGTTAAADPPSPATKSRPVSDTREAPPEVREKSEVKLTRTEKREFANDAPTVGRQVRRQSQAEAPDATGTPVGGEKTWLILDQYNGQYVPATYVLRGVGTGLEVWVQKDINFPDGDCRNDGVRNVVTDSQVQSLITEFDENIFPKESQYFSTAPARDGTEQTDVGFGGPLWQLLGGGDPTYYQGDGNNTVALISNVRDDNFYAPTTPDGQTYFAGFFSPTYNEAFDRNIMTIDSYDWLHRTGANPPDEAAMPSLCSTKQPARPRLYEGTFAHEYQHLLHYYTDPDETSWLNEGLSDYAQTLVGYVDTTIPYGQPGADSRIACFQGFAGRADFPYCGAENSLTRWGDQGSPSILADYGAAYTFITYVENMFGRAAVTYLHRDGANGLDSLQRYLDDYAPGLKSIDMVHDWAAMMAVDRWVDNGARGLTRDQKRRFTARELNAAIDWSWTGSYDSPGAPANGSDYVLGIAERPVNSDTLNRVRFVGSSSYAPDPLEWVVSDDALYSGTGHNVDRAAVFSVDVPATGDLTFSTKYDIEEGWDFGLVQVSTDGGATYTSLANANTTTEHASDADGTIVAELPGFTGLSDGFQTETFDMSAYAGKQVLLSFRYMTDVAVNGNSTAPSGWWIRDVKVGDVVVTSGTTTDGARSPTEVRPVPVAGWKVQAVGWTLGQDNVKVKYVDLKLNRNNAVTLRRSELRRLFRNSQRVGFIVTVDDPDEVATKNANYRLRVNGVLQPGGSGDTDRPPVALLLSKALPIRIS